MNNLGFTPFAERQIEFLGVRDLPGCRLKVYSVVFGDESFDLTRFEPAYEIAASAIPPADLSSGRPGVGFVIFHQGNSCDYVVACWWSRENELPTRVYVGHDGVWRVAREDESFCVWDLEIIYFEREAYVRTMLSAEGGDRAAYIDACLGARTRRHLLGGCADHP